MRQHSTDVPVTGDHYHDGFPGEVAALAAVANGSQAEAKKFLPIFSGANSCLRYSCMHSDRLSGLLAATARHVQEAESQFVAAVEFCRNASYRPELAWACSDYSDLLLDRNAPGDREKALELQDEAISIATELGMKPLLERVLAKREILKA